MNVEAVREITTRKRAAGIHLMAASQGHKHQFVFIEYRANKTPVGQVIATTVVGVVCNYNVPWMQVVAKFIENVFDTKMLREKHRRGPFGHRNCTSLGIPDAGRHVVQYCQQIVLRGSIDNVAHLSGDALKCIPGGR